MKHNNEYRGLSAIARYLIFGAVFYGYTITSNTPQQAPTIPQLTEKMPQPAPTIPQLTEAEIAQLNDMSTSELLDRLKEQVHNVCGLASTIKPVTAEHVRDMLRANPDLCVVNVLGVRYYEDCRIACKRSVNVPLKQLVSLVQTWERTKDYVVYCALSDCDASEKACVLMRCMGFENLFEYKGGIKDWFQKKNQNEHPTAGPCECEYLHIRATRQDEPQSCQEARDFNLTVALHPSVFAKATPDAVDTNRAF